MVPVASHSFSSRLVIRKPLMTKNTETPKCAKSRKVPTGRLTQREKFWLECAITTRRIEMAPKPSRDGILLALAVISTPLVELRISNPENLYFCEIYNHAHRPPRYGRETAPASQLIDQLPAPLKE